MLDKVRVFLSPHSEGGVRLDGKTGKEAKDLASTKELYKQHQQELNRALDNAVFKKLADFLPDNKFDIDNKEDRGAMQALLERNIARPMDAIVKQAYLDGLMLLDEINSVYGDKISADKKVMDGTKKEVEALRSDILADLNNDLTAGTEVKNAGKYERKSAKIDRINQQQKDIIAELHTTLTRKDAMLVESFITKGLLTRTRFEKGLADMYLDAKHPNYETGSKAQKKEWREDAKIWADGISDELKDAKLWKAMKQVNNFEKAEDRIEGRKQRATEYNKEETIYTEAQLKSMLDTTAMIMGKDEFAKAFAAKINLMRPDNTLPKWDNMAGLNQTLNNPTHSQYIRQFLKENQKFLTVSNMQDWLDTETSPGAMLDMYRMQIEEQHKTELTTILQGLFPDLSEAELIKKRGEVVAQIAAGLMSVTNGTTGMEMRGAGLGAGVTFTGLDKVTPLVSRISIGAGVTDKGIPGIAVDFGKDFSWRTGGVHMDAGVANFVIPFARLGVDQTINMNALRKNLEAKRAWKVGAYAEAAPGYAGVGINAGSDLLAGINHQERNIQSQLYNALSTLHENSGVTTAAQEIKKLFPRADEKTLNAAAQHLIDGLKQGYTAEDIAATFATAWKNEAVKNSKGKVDVSLEAGVGTLLTVPVLKAFIGLKIYKRATMLEDKFDKSAKEQELSTFRGFSRFDNADVKNMSMKEKIAYWLGDKVAVTEDKNTISIMLRNPNTGTKKGEIAIYDQFDIYVKDQNNVSVSDNVITFSKGDNILMGKLIGSTGEKQKIYIGYDYDNDIESAKFPLNNKINGNAENVKTTAMEEYELKGQKETLSFNFEPKLDAADANFINNCTINKMEAFTKATHPSNKQRLVYNKTFGEFVSSTRGTDFDAMKKNILAVNKFVNVIDAKDMKQFDAIWAKGNEHKRAMVNSLIQVGSYSARLEAIMTGNGLAGSKNVGELLKKRTGHLEAFKNSGVIVDPHAFDSIYNKAKSIDGKKEQYTETRIDNAVALVGYYRSGLTPTTGLIGFGDVHILAGKQYREDASKETAVFNKFLEIYQKSADYASQKATMQKSFEKFAPGAKIDDASFVKLLKGEKLTINGVELQMKGNTFEKVLNGPCANESYMMAFGKLEITYSKKEKRSVEKPGDIFVGMEHIDNYQKAKSIKLGVGTMYGDKPKKEDTPTKWEDGKPVSNPGDDTNPTVLDDGGSATNVGGDTVGTDTGDGSPNGE